MARRKSVKKKGSFAAKAVAGGLLVCALAVAIGFASTTILSPNEVSAGLGSSGAFRSDISVSETVARPAALAAEGNPSAAAQAPGAANGADTDAKGGSQTTPDASSESSTDVFATAFEQSSPLNTMAQCDISAGLKIMNDRIEEERRKAEEARLAAERAHIAEVQERQRAYGGESAVNTVDFSVGKDAFIEEWTERLDNYLSGSPLSGHGVDFAEAAWEYGVDPRFSPAISNTESGKGSHCFLPHNAWGWGASIWFNWTDAIWDHVKGLSDGYGYSISYSGASKYCPPNTDNWYHNTLNEMNKM